MEFRLDGNTIVHGFSLRIRGVGKPDWSDWVTFAWCWLGALRSIEVGEIKYIFHVDGTSRSEEALTLPLRVIWPDAEGLREDRWHLNFEYRLP